MLTQDEFTRKFRGPLLLLLTEAWACQRESRAELAALLEQHHVRCKDLLKEMYAEMTKPEPKAAVNGVPATPVRQTK